MSLTESEFVMAVNLAFGAELEKLHSLFQSNREPSFPSIDNMPHDMEYQPSKVESIEHESRALFPLGMHHAPFYVTRNTVLIGDAARRVHPLAGQGFNMGIGDVMQLTHSIHHDIESGNSIGRFCRSIDGRLDRTLDENSFFQYFLCLLKGMRLKQVFLGNPITMKDYVRSRHREVLPLMTAIDGLQRLFGTDNSAVASIRSFGLNLFDRLPIVKVSMEMYLVF